MSTVKVFTKNEKGCVKPMNCVVGGPLTRAKTEHPEMVMDGFTLYKNLEIPMARNHDASPCRRSYDIPRL